ncbi:hypothetical protein D8674_018408 [Pyrus ussuriensis x Pyrus communis]|uniref:HTH OST-type domain-containing protein n=1 Tax=Pyrus ussuriensis x Pyrus communis TaxID=2448454 RepID=A0A5N5G4R4_9ROSA|nr:hypothetical protein D8674_018408 [Pyrus ussuriensis x Pyrus communis]
MEGTATAATEQRPDWLLYFEVWFLNLLDRLRQTERSWDDGYPLASLKQDFRFETGFEIDHQALGFENLRGFIIHGYSRICTVETVGRGRNQRLIIRPIKAPIGHISPAAEFFCVLLFAVAVGSKKLKHRAVFRKPSGRHEARPIPSSCTGRSEESVDYATEVEFCLQLPCNYQQRLSKKAYVLDETKDDLVSLNVFRKFGFRIIVILFGGDHRMIRYVSMSLR